MCACVHLCVACVCVCVCVCALGGLEISLLEEATDVGQEDCVCVCVDTCRCWMTRMLGGASVQVTTNLTRSGTTTPPTNAQTHTLNVPHKTSSHNNSTSRER